MDNKQKVIKEKLDEMVELTRGLSYASFMTAVENANDILALLKKQDAVEPEWYDKTPFCGNCGHRLEKKSRNTDEIKCPTCGRLVKWE